MRTWKKTAGLVLMAASAVAWPALHSGAVTAETTSTGPKELSAAQDASDPFAAPAAPTTHEITPAAQPDSGGQSAVAPQVDVKNSGNFEIHVNNTPLAMVLRMLSGQSHRNIIASKEVHGTITADLYDVTLKEALDAILLSNDYAYVMKGDFIYVYTAKELEEKQQRERVKKTEVFRLFYTPAADVMKLLMPVLSKDAVYAQTAAALTSLDDSSSSGTTGGSGSAGGSGGTSGGGAGGGSSGGSGGNQHAGDDMLVITDYEENLARAKQVIQQVDHRPQQVLIEATILSAGLNENNALGVNFTVLGGVNFSTLGAINGASSGGTTTGGAAAASGTAGATGTGTAAGVSPSAAVSSALTGAIIDNTAAGSLLHSGYSAAQFGGAGLNIGLITNNVGMFLTALEAVTDTTVLANPKVLVLNKQQGMVHVGENIGYSTAITTETTTTSTVSFLSTGVSLVFRPYIGDNGYIRLDIHPENSTGNLDAKGNPDQYTTEIATDVMVKDGRTIVIGGLFEDQTTRTRSQVPFLGSLPVVGALFRQQADATQRQEIIILLTPHIVKDLDAYGDASDAESRYVERLEVGARKGLMPWGRERLAESWYERAVDEMSKPHPNRQLALWNLNCAISLNPMFSEAMELRAQITGKEMTATDDSTIRSFVKDQIMAEQMAPTSQPAVAAAVMLNDLPGPGDAWRPWPGPMGATVLGPNRDADRPKITRSDTRPAGAGLNATATTYIPNEPIETAPASSDEQK